MLLSAVLFAVALSVASGCSSGKSNVYSWKPKAAQQPQAHARATTRPAQVNSTQAGADILEESHRAASVTWIAVPSPDGKKTVWVQVK